MNRLGLLIVDCETVQPHERAQPARVTALSERLASARLLRDPIVVLANGGGHMVLDGATRLAALRKLGCDHIVVQNVAQHDVRLAEWNHLVLSDDLDDLADIIRQMPGIVLSREPTPGSGHLVLPGGDRWSLSFDGEGDLATVLARLADTCAGLGTVIRTTSDLDPEEGALVIYPRFTMDDVLQAADSRRLLPAGVTRFVVPGRVLRLDYPLDMLHFREPTSLKQRRLDDFVATRFRAGAVRRYDESVILLDEA